MYANVNVNVHVTVNLNASVYAHACLTVGPALVLALAPVLDRDRRLTSPETLSVAEAAKVHCGTVVFWQSGQNRRVRCGVCVASTDGQDGVVEESDVRDVDGDDADAGCRWQ